MIGKKEPVFRGRLENLPSAAAALTSSHDGSRRDSGIFCFSVPYYDLIVDTNAKGFSSYVSIKEKVKAFIKEHTEFSIFS